MDQTLDIDQILREKQKNHHVTIKKLDLETHPVHVIYIPAITDTKQVQDAILLPLQEWKHKESPLPHAFSAEPLLQLEKKNDIDRYLLDG